jgi:hypothetical protein
LVKLPPSVRVIAGQLDFLDEERFLVLVLLALLAATPGGRRGLF